MASITKGKNRESWKLSWYDLVDCRKSMSLGKMPKKSAEQFKVRFEEIQGVQRSGGTMSQSLNEWVKSLAPDLRAKLEDVGLVERTKRILLGSFCEEYKKARTGIAKATVVRDRQVCDLLVEYFKADRELGSIGAKEAEAWTLWLTSKGNKRDTKRTTLAANTVRRRTGTASQIMSKAIRWGLIKDNPFDGLPTTVRENKDRQEFVKWETIEKVIRAAPSIEWKALLAFVRLVGPRVPSELAGLTWVDIDFTSNRILLRSPKTKHHGSDHSERLCPMFPELRPYLVELFRSIGDGNRVLDSDPVFPIATSPGVNLGTTLKRLIVRAGVTPWQKLFANLRSSRETELMATYPAIDVCAWFGHSPAVAARFYAQVRSETADRAIKEYTVGSAAESPEADQKVGAVVGAIKDEMGAKPCAINDCHQGSNSYQRGPKHQEKDGVLIGTDGASVAPDGEYKWTILDSNQRPPRCQRGALTN